MHEELRDSDGLPRVKKSSIGLSHLLDMVDYKNIDVLCHEISFQEYFLVYGRKFRTVYFTTCVRALVRLHMRAVRRSREDTRYHGTASKAGSQFSFFSRLAT